MTRELAPCGTRAAAEYVRDRRAASKAGQPATTDHVHLAMTCTVGDPGCPGPVACYGIDICRPPHWARTTSPADVTCSKCLISPAYQEAT